MVELLIERGADLSFEVPLVGWTALMFAVQNDHIDVVKALMAAEKEKAGVLGRPHHLGRWRSKIQYL
jgi:ankyrin repeat protein